MGNGREEMVGALVVVVVKGSGREETPEGTSWVVEVMNICNRQLRFEMAS